jgi:hypothetical protein
MRETAAVLHEAFPDWELRDMAGAGHKGPLTHGPIVNAGIRRGPDPIFEMHGYKLSEKRRSQS